MSITHVIGIDPGPVPGFVHLILRDFDTEVEVIQCSENVAPIVLRTLLTDRRFGRDTASAIVAIEKFVVGRGSMRSGRAGGTTRDLVGKLQREAAEQPNVTVVMRSAAAVKPWATDLRLNETRVNGDSSLFLATAGMRHARDAARHALFAAVHDAGAPDPLSRKARA